VRQQAYCAAAPLSVFCCALSFFAMCAVAAPAAQPSVASYLASLSEQLPQPQREALRRIGDPARRLLAARGYLRADDRLRSRWSWSAAQIDAHRASDEYRRMLADVDAVKARFEAQNPGYTLYANTAVRSLDVQLERWSENRAIGALAKELQRAAASHLREERYPSKPGSADLTRFESFVREWQPSQAAPLAAPGLSLHGQSRALDFQVHRHGKIVAGPEVAAVEAVWNKHGWSHKLQRALGPQRRNFVGPLQAPNEPWHYEYVADEPLSTEAPR
jgi:hypothetical protein